MVKQFRSSDFAGRPRSLNPRNRYISKSRSRTPPYKVYQLRAQSMRRITQSVRRLNSMIETKEGTRRVATNYALTHNYLSVLGDANTGLALNPFHFGQGTGDPMVAGDGNRIGDKISVKGLMIRAFFENSTSRPKVYYRFMVIKAAKGDVPTRDTLFKGDSPNKMIDQVNTERFSIVYQKVFNIRTGNTAPTGVSVAGVPTGETGGGQGTRTLKIWIPGRKFGRYGNIQYENGAQQIKFYDYYLCMLVYDWYGTPQDVNNIGKINELYTKVYFKDA